MVREPNATTRPAHQDNQLMSKHRVLGFKPQLRPEWRCQDGQSEAEQQPLPNDVLKIVTPERGHQA
jgi:hypothetical protein